jgi:hypothetical protein
VLSCPKCGAAIEPAEVDNSIQAARCRTCRRLVDLSAQLGTAPPSGVSAAPSVVTPAFGGLRSRPAEPVAEPVPAAGVAAPRGPVPMPPKFRIEHSPDLTITFNWFGPQFLFLVLFCAFWDGFLVLWYSVVIGLMLAGSGPGILPMAVFPLLHVGVGVGLTYYTVCGFVNSTTLRVGTGTLSVNHGPLPWKGNCVIPTGTIEQLYSEQRVHRGKNGTTYTYDVMVQERDGLQRKLVTGLSEPSHALFLEQTLEGHLGITDRPVGGELPR